MPYSGDMTFPPGNLGRGLPGQWKTSTPTTATAVAFPPGSDEWWLHAGISAIESKQRDHAIRFAYVDGDHPLPNGDRRYVKALRDFQEKSMTNYIELATLAPIQRMQVKGFRFGRGDEGDSNSSGRSNPSGRVSGGNPTDQTALKSSENSTAGGQSASRGVADRDARRVWMANDMDLQMEGFLKDAATFGESYLLAGPEDEETGEPTITAEDPRCAHVFADPVRPTRSLAGIRIWRDQYIGQVIAVLYTPGAVTSYIGPKNSNPDAMSLSLAQGGFKVLSRAVNPIGEVPLVRCQWRPDGKAEAEGIFSIQDRINLTILDRLVISKSQAYRQRWMTGGQLTKQGKRGKNANDQKPPLDPGADVLWHVPAPDAKFGDFDAADITQILTAVRDDVIDAAAIQQMPAHYLMGRMANVSGDTLTQAESGFVMRVKSRQRAVGWALEKAMRLVFKYKGDEKKAKEWDAEVIWGDPEVRSMAEKADASVKFSQAFATAPPYMIPILADLMNLDPDQVERLVAGAAEWQEQQLQREQQMLQAQTDSAIAVAKETGAAEKKAGSGSPAKKPN